MNDPYSQGGGVALALLGVWSVVGIAVYVWYLWSLSRLFPKLGLPSVYGWIPLWNQWQLVQRAGLPGWIVLLGFVPGLSIVVLVVSIIAMHRLNTEHGKGAGFTVLGAFIPPLWAMLLANHIGDQGQLVQQAAPGAYPAPGVAGQGAQPQQHAQGVQAPQADWQGLPPVSGFGAPAAPPAQPVQPAQPVAPQRPAAFAPGQPEPTPYGAQPPAQPQQNLWSAPAPAVAPPAAAAPPAAVPPSAHMPQVQPPRMPAPQAPAPQAQAPVAPAAPAVPTAPATPTPPLTPPAAADIFAQPPAPSNNWGFSTTNDAEYHRLATEAGSERASAPLGEVPPERPFSWPAPYETFVPRDDSPLTLPEPEAAAPGAAPAAEAAPSAPAPAAAPAIDPFAAVISGKAPSAPAPAAAEPVAAEPVAAEPVAAEPVAEPEPIAHPEPAAEPVAAPEPIAAPPIMDVTGAAGGGAADPAPAAAAPAPAAAVSADDSFDEDHTVMVPRRTRWGLETPDGKVYELVGDDVVIGRKPTPRPGAMVLQLEDPTRTISKTHARMRRSGDAWTIEDLGSTNGVAVTADDGVATQIEQGTPVAATEALVVGTLDVKLIRIS